MRRTVVVPHSSPPSETTRWTLMGLIGSGLRLLAVTWSKPPAEHRVSRIARPDVLLSLVRAPALLPQHADFGSQFHTPSNRCLRFGPRVTATPARLAPVLPARLWTDQTFTGRLIPAFLSHPPSGLYGVSFSRGGHAILVVLCIPFFCSTRAASILPSRPPYFHRRRAQRRSRTALLQRRR